MYRRSSRYLLLLALAAESFNFVYLLVQEVWMHCGAGLEERQKQLSLTPGYHFGGRAAAVRAIFAPDASTGLLPSSVRFQFSMPRKGRNPQPPTAFGRRCRTDLECLATALQCHPRLCGVQLPSASFLLLKNITIVGSAATIRDFFN